MAIVVKLEALMLQHGISLDKIAAATGITNVNVSRLKTGKVVAYRGTTIDALIKALRALGVEGCDVADVLGFVPDDEIASIGEGLHQRAEEPPSHEQSLQRRREGEAARRGRSEDTMKSEQ